MDVITQSWALVTLSISGALVLVAGILIGFSYWRSNSPGRLSTTSTLLLVAAAVPFASAGYTYYGLDDHTMVTPNDVGGTRTVHTPFWPGFASSITSGLVIILFSAYIYHLTDDDGQGEKARGKSATAANKLVMYAPIIENGKAGLVYGPGILMFAMQLTLFLTWWLNINFWPLVALAIFLGLVFIFQAISLGVLGLKARREILATKPSELPPRIKGSRPQLATKYTVWTALWFSYWIIVMISTWVIWGTSAGVNTGVTDANLATTDDTYVSLFTINMLFGIALAATSLAVFELTAPHRKGSIADRVFDEKDAS